MKRTDKFRPSVIDPTKFEFVAHHYIGGMSDDTWESLADVLTEAAEQLEAHQLAHPGANVAGHKWPGQCDCCGARYKFGATFYTAETHTYIAIGGICAGKLSLGSPSAMKTFREQVNTWKVHQERVTKARAYLTTVNLVAMLDLWLTKERGANDGEFPERTLRDMCGKVVQWANELSEKQQAFAHKLLTQIADRPRLLAEREAKDANRKPVPTTDKRMTVEGTVISCKYSAGGWEDGKDFFQPEGFKVTVEHADGWRVWGSLASGIAPSYGWENGKHVSGDSVAESMKGRKVKFDARVTPSDKDNKFGFFKRPTKGEFCDAVPDAAVEAA